MEVKQTARLHAFAGCGRVLKSLTVAENSNDWVFHISIKRLDKFSRIEENETWFNQIARF